MRRILLTVLTTALVASGIAGVIHSGSDKHPKLKTEVRYLAKYETLRTQVRDVHAGRLFDRCLRRQLGANGRQAGKATGEAVKVAVGRCTRYLPSGPIGAVHGYESQALANATGRPVDVVVQ